MQEQLSRLLVAKVLRHRVLVSVEVLDHGLERAVLAHQLERPLRSDSLDRIAIITAKQYTQIDKLSV